MEKSWKQIKFCHFKIESRNPIGLMNLLCKIFVQQKQTLNAVLVLFIHELALQPDYSISVLGSSVLPVAQAKISQSSLTLLSSYSSSSPLAHLVTSLFIKYPKSNHPQYGYYPVPSQYLFPCIISRYCQYLQ